MSVERPAASDVRVVIETSLSDLQIEGLITEAVLMVEKCVSSYEAERQKAIVRWVTAYLIDNIRNQGGGGVQSDSLGDASRSYFSGALGEGLAENGYGLKAIALDPSGCLMRIGKSKATIEVI